MLCLDICPFSGEGPSIDDVSQTLFGQLPGLNRKDEIGSFLSAWEGYALRGEFRTRGASGGMASWFLTKVLEEGVADAVISAGPDERRPGTWTFIRTRNPDEAISRAGSVYHPVPFDEAVRTILSEQTGERLAVVALPCLAYGLRKAMRKIPLLGEKIVLLASLTCGLMPTRRYSDYISLESGILPEDMGCINFRLPPKEPDSGNYRHVAISRDREPGKPVPVKGVPDFLWGHGGFIQGGCLVCDDVFGETADVVFMDAWLPEYSRETRGNSIVLCRTPAADSIVRNGITGGECLAREIGADRLVLSQGETLRIKRLLLAGRLARLEEKGCHLPPEKGNT
jgi:coenzyme F420-reducing hydrogenase beta subunit